MIRRGVVSICRYFLLFVIQCFLDLPGYILVSKVPITNVENLLTYISNGPI